MGKERRTREKTEREGKSVGQKGREVRGSILLRGGGERDVMGGRG